MTVCLNGGPRDQVFGKGTLVLKNDRTPGCGLPRDLMNSLDTVVVRGIDGFIGRFHVPSGRATLLDSFRGGERRVTQVTVRRGIAGVDNIPS